jgi:hypothetical protein
MRSTTVAWGLAVAVGLWLGPSAAHAQAGGSGQQERMPLPTNPSPTDPNTKPPAPEELTFTTHLDKTAVWVGDQFHYRIFVDHDPSIQFILDNLNAETINLDPLTVLNVATSIFPLKDGTQRLVVDLTVSHFVTGVTQLQIPQLTLFYFRSEGGAAATAATTEGAAAESLTVQGPIIGVRSTLPPRPTDIRDAVTVNAWPRNRWIVVGAGWTALALLVAGAVWQSVVFVRQRRRGEGPDPRKLMAAVRQRWSDSVPDQFGDQSTIMEFYGRSYRDLKEYLGYMLDAPTAGLMADEIRAEVTRRANNPDLADRAGKILDVCETARYAPNSPELNGDTARTVADDMRHIFEAGSRL